MNTLLHTFNPTLYGEFTVGVNWAHQNTSPFDDAARDANDRRVVLPGMPQFFPARIRCASSRRRLRRRRSRQPASVRHRAAVSLLRLQHAVQRVRQSHEDQRRAHHEGRPLRGAHDAARGADVELQRQLQLQHRQPEPLNTNVGFANALIGAITEYRVGRSSSAHGEFLIESTRRTRGG